MFLRVAEAKVVKPRSRITMDSILVLHCFHLGFEDVNLQFKLKENLISHSCIFVVIFLLNFLVLMHIAQCDKTKFGALWQWHQYYD